ncbi:unnamed protein product, partial [Owenia fusiformis]
LIGITKNPSFLRRVWKYDNVNVSTLNNSIRHSRLCNIIEDSNDLNNIGKEFTSSLFDIFCSCIPNKQIRVKSNDKPWFTDKIRTLINKRNKCHYAFRHSNKPEQFDRYLAQCTIVDNAITQAKLEHEKRIISKMETQHFGSKSYWNITSKLFSNSRSSSIPILVDDLGNTVRSGKDKANIFLNHFIKSFHFEGPVDNAFLH